MPSFFKPFVAVVCLVFALCFAAPNAHADSTFDVSSVATNESGGSLGSCAAGATCSFSGTLTIDVTTGTLTGIDITFPGLAAFTTLSGGVGSKGGEAYLGASNSTNSLTLDFSTMPTFSGSLVGFTGGSILAAEVQSGNFTGPELYLNFGGEGGSITPATTAAPEPSSLALMLSGVGLVFVMRKRWA